MHTISNNILSYDTQSDEENVLLIEDKKNKIHKTIVLDGIKKLEEKK